MADVAVLGTGTMGAAMTRNLLKAGHRVRVWNRTHEKAEPLAQDGATVASSPAEAVAGAEIVLTMLADGQGVEKTVSQIDSLPLWIQASTVGIDATERLARLADEKGAVFVDAPVLGTKEPAERGELVVLASGPEEAREPSRPIFDAIGKKTLRLGEAGQGSRLKLVVNNWLLSLVEGLAESISLSQALGVDPGRFFDAIEGGPLDVPYAHVKGKAMIDREFPPSFSVKLAHKDAELVLEAAGRHALELPFAAAVERQLARTAELGHADEDLAAVYYASAKDAGGPSG